MPRLIDADKVREQKYKSIQYERTIVNELSDDPSIAFMCGWNEALDSVYQYALTIEIVRCNDCIHQAECAFTEWLGRNGNGFCSCGERKEDGDNH